jgi:hypothetical protein
MPCQGKAGAYSGASCLLPCGELHIAKTSEGHIVAKSRGVRQDWAGRRLGGTQSQVRCPVERRLDTFTVGSPNSSLCDRESDAQRVDEAVLHYWSTTAATVVWGMGMGYCYCYCQGLHA